jgi:hypothetical protein
VRAAQRVLAPRVLSTPTGHRYDCNVYGYVRSREGSQLFWVNMLIFVKPTNVKSDPEGKQKSLDEDKEDKDEKKDEDN